jgi:protein TonB
MISYEKTSKKIGIVATVGIHILLFICLLLIAASHNEPIPLTFGVAVNYGTSDEGFGTQQNYNTPSNNPSTETQKATSKTEVKETQFIDNKIVTPNNQTTPAVVTEKMSKADLLASQDKDAPPIATEVKQEKTTPTTDPSPPQPPNPNTVITKGNTGGTEDGKSNKGGGNNNGNKESTVGDMGNPNGDINADALLGTGGTGNGGASFEMAGWVWDDKPIVNDKSAETGKIIFEIKIDNDGEVISVKNIYSTVSRSVANLYEKAVYKITFSPTIENGNRAAVTTGKIIFIIKSR